MSSSDMGRDVRSLTMFIQHFLCRSSPDIMIWLTWLKRKQTTQNKTTTTNPPANYLLCRPQRRPHQGALRDGLGDTDVVRDVPEPCKFPSFDSCQKRFLWTHKDVDLARPPVVGLVLQVGDAEECSQTLGFESLESFSESASRVYVYRPERRMEMTRDLYDLKLFVKLMVLFNLAIVAVC